VKLSAHIRAGLPGNEISFLIVPLPACRRQGHRLSRHRQDGALDGQRCVCKRGDMQDQSKEMINQFRWILTVLLVVIFLSLTTSAISGEIYKWIDKDGNIHFSDTPPPPGVDAEIKRFKEEPTEKPRTKWDTSKPRIDSPREKRPYRNINVIMYMTSWCGYCRKAREFIHSLDVNLIEYNIEKDLARREEMLSKSVGSKGVPLIDVEGIIIRGFNPEAIKVAVEKRRGL
jgi:glutaredoxin